MSVPGIVGSKVPERLVVQSWVKVLIGILNLAVSA
jgi:hypothetical protein